MPCLDYKTFIGNYYEATIAPTASTRSYFSVGAARAMRDGSGSGESGLTWLFTDHLGSYDCGAG